MKSIEIYIWKNKSVIYGDIYNMAIEKTVKIRKNRKCECCGELHKKGATMLFKEWKGSVIDENEIQTGIKYHRYYYCYDPIDSLIEDEEYGTILIPACAQVNLV